MRIVFLADARSPIAQNWISYFIKRGHEVHVISSYPCSADALPNAAEIHQVQVAFSGLSKIGHDGTIGQNKRGSLSLLSPILATLRSGSFARLGVNVRHWLAPLEINRHVSQVRELISDISPDFVHAMRIPFEGILAAKATPPRVPLLISVWGNDFTLFAERYWLIGKQTRYALRRASALHCDCKRDLKLAHRWGFSPGKPAAVLPGAGGVQALIFNSGQCDPALQESLRIPESAPVVFNPRGFRRYVRNDTFFKAIPRILRERPEVIFICSAMQGNPTAEKWVAQFNIAENVRLLPYVPRRQMADLFRMAQITVSPSTHDGTPNTLLEAIACGCFPVAGNTESLREWIDNDVNGLLCDPASPQLLADAILKALSDEEMRRRAKSHNLELIAQRADYDHVMRKAAEFYRLLIESGQSSFSDTLA